MARKVLISFVGTGALLKPYSNESNKEGVNARKYKSATYHIDGEKYETSFVADALATHCKIDDIILIGTAKSMWEAVYETFCAKHGIEKDDEYYLELGVHCENANHKSSLELPDIEKLESALGKQSHVVLINYGLTEDELNNNMSKILGIEKYLISGDELYVDITHSFRSLPMLLMNTLIYMQNVSRKNINISHIFYGMLDVSGELGYTPVVDMKKIIDVNDWISGAYSFMEFGNAYKISKLLKSVENSASTSTILSDFSDSNNINNLYALQQQIQRLQAVSVEKLPDIAKMTVAPVIKDFKSRLGTFNSTSEFQYKLARWHWDKHNYSSAYLTLTEAIITYVCEECKWNYTDQTEREKAKDKLVNYFEDKEWPQKHPEYKTLKKVYNNINGIRNTIAHAIEHKRSNREIIKTLKDAIEQLGKILC